MQASPFLKSNSTRSMKNQIISGVEWSMDIFNCSFRAFSRLLLLLLRRSSEHSVWLKFERKIQEYFRKFLHWPASDLCKDGEHGRARRAGKVRIQSMMMMVVLKMKSMRIMRWESESEDKFEFAKKSESEKLFRRLEVATETLAAHMRLMIMMPWWLSSWYLYWLGNSCNNGNIIPLIVLKMMLLIIVLGNITTMRVKITMWIFLIIQWHWTPRRQCQIRVRFESRGK